MSEWTGIYASKFAGPAYESVKNSERLAQSLLPSGRRCPKGG